jgi:hypothetical protein
LLQRRLLRIAISLLAVVALLDASVIPAAHAHAQSSGQTLVHSHLTAGPVEHPTTLDHGEHHHDVTPSLSFMSERPVPFDPAVVLDTRAIGAPELRQLGHVDTLDAPVIHGPPRGRLSPRAPPA